MCLNRNLLLGASLVAMACLGCGPGGPKIASVEGTVKMDGEPLADASVVFVPQNGRPAGAKTDAQGHYVLTFTKGRRGALPGMNKVRISTAADPSETPDGQPIPAKAEIVPKKYNALTELEFDVKDGEKNVANFDLDSEGELPDADSIVADSLGEDSDGSNDSE